MGYYRFYIFIFALLFCVFISCSNDPLANNGSKTSTLKQTEEDISLSLNEDLYNSFSSNITRTDLDEEDSYPTYFGGSYTDSKDSLVIFVKDMNKMEFLIFITELENIQIYFLNHAHIL